jgi:hypothetical protein
MERFHDSICFRKEEYDMKKTPQNTVSVPMEVIKPLWH